VNPNSPITSKKVIHVEGMDLAGKSTATAAVERLHPGCVVRHNALTANNPIFELADELRRSAKVSAAVLGPMYVAATLLDIATYEDPDTVTIQDSTVALRSIAFNTALGNDTVATQLLELLEQHPRFGCSIVLTATLEARMRRLEQRYRDAPHEVAPDDLAIKTNPSRFLEMERLLVDLAVTEFDAHVIDTSDLAPHEVMNVVTTITQGVLP
jgi:thymidylate kinase